MNCLNLLNMAQKNLSQNNILTFSLDSEILLAHALKINREKLLCNLEKKPSKIQVKLFEKLIILRMQKMPIAYIVNKKEFWKRSFGMNKSVLIPRPETELIVEKILKKINKYDRKNILDIGTGSGCILISILLDRKNCKGTALDISKSAINTAKTNAKIQHVENRIAFINSDIDKFSSNKYDLIVSNPPYIEKLKIKCLSEDIKNYEPIIALNGGISGVEIQKKVIERSSKLIKTGGNLLLEIEKNQIYMLKKILIKEKFFLNEVAKDIYGHKRCLIATKL